MAGVTTCLLLHGAGSTPEFIERAFGAAVAASGWELIAPDVAGATMPDMLTVIAGSGLGTDDVVGGVSLGAHAAARYCASTGWRGHLLGVMPAWLGEPGAVAALTGQTADDVQRSSAAEVLAQISRHTDPRDWILAELRRAWLSMPDERLVAALRVAAAQPAPTAPELATIRARTTVVALADDPTHPETVARAWAAAIPGARLRVLPRDLGGQGPEFLAQQAVTAVCRRDWSQDGTY